MAILKYLNAHNFLIFQPILMILVSKFVVHRALSKKNTHRRVVVSFKLLSKHPLKSRLHMLV